ncbi:MAG: XdhC family protein [Gemmatimonadaceae bacterium]
MDTLDRTLEEFRRSERHVALATLVAAKGTTPKKAGATMWVAGDGRVLGSVTIGGCVDAEVIARAADVITSGRSELLSLSLGDDDAWAIGLTCGGAVDVLVERVDVRDADDPVVAAHRAVRAAREAGRAAVVVTPLGGGAARLVVHADGTRTGSLGDTALDDAAAAAALMALRGGASRAVTLDASAGGGAAADHFLDVHAPPVTLIAFGGTHVAIPLVAFAHQLGWRTVVVEPRPTFATPERFPLADEILAGAIDDHAARMRYTPATAVVLTAHDYKFEIPVLKIVLASDAGYVGLLGNRKRGAAVLDYLAADGVSRETLSRVHVPVGLDIGAQGAAEIALSIAAEIVQSMRRGAGA